MKFSTYIIPFLFILLGVFIGFQLDGILSSETEVEKVPYPVTVTLDSIVKVHDTIYEPVPIPGKHTIDSTYYHKYISLKDSVSRLELYKEAITVNDYLKVFNDSVQDIYVYSKSRGDILEQSISYNLHPRTVTVPDSVPVIRKPEFLIGGGTALPLLNNALDPAPVIDLRAGIRTKKGNVISAGIDTEGRVLGGILFKISK